MSRELIQQHLIEWISETGRFTAPYGILDSKSPDGKYRSITFGIARVTDIELRIYSPKWFLLRDSRYGDHKFLSTEEVKEWLSTQYGLTSQAK